MAETSQHGDCSRVKISCRDRLNEGGKVGPAHRKVAGEDLEEALVELGLNELNEGGRHILLHCCLCSKTGVYFI